MHNTEKVASPVLGRRLARLMGFGRFAVIHGQKGDNP
jgi:hypothetical protein